MWKTGAKMGDNPPLTHTLRGIAPAIAPNIVKKGNYGAFYPPEEPIFTSNILQQKNDSYGTGGG
jgi:hypothetical protein